MEEVEQSDFPSSASRFGSVLCAGLPWMREEFYVEPHGMIERPPHCRYPRECAKDRVCLMAQGREEQAWREHREIHRRDLRSGRTDIEVFETWAGLDVAA